jgi:hypothetical protein
LTGNAQAISIRLRDVAEQSLVDSIEVNVVIRFVEMPGENAPQGATPFDGAANTEE